MSRTPLRRSKRIKSSVRSLFSERLERRLLLAAVTAQDPAANSFDAATTTNVSVTFDEAINPATATADTLVVAGQHSGRLTAGDATVTTDGSTVTLDPAASFSPGERVFVTATSGIAAAGGSANQPYVFEFRTAVNSGSGQFTDSGQVLGTNQDGEIFASDLDADGDLDVVQGGNIVWLNDGSGNFTDSGQNLGGINSVLADVDGDGDADLVDQNNVYINDGNAIFTGTGQDLTPSGGALAIEVGDLDGDGDIDAMAGIAYSGNLVWINNGSGSFTNSGQSLGNSASRGLAFGDVDGDGDLDAIAANNGPANRVWLNDGSANFTDSTQQLGGFRATNQVDVGDVDGDGDVDLLFASNPGTRLYLNDGNGVFIQAGPTINDGTSNEDAQLADLDADGDLDVYATGWNNDSEIWFNDGSGVFAQGQSLNYGGLRRAGWVGLFDVDNDGDIDAFEGNRFAGGARVWINQNLEPSVSLAVDPASIAEADGVATVTAQLSAAHTLPVTVTLGFSGTATATDDYTTSAGEIVIPAGETSASATVTAVQDSQDEPDETVVIDIASIANGQEAGTQQVTVTIIDDDEPPMPDVTLSVDNESIAEAGGTATFTATVSETTTATVTVELAISGTATAGTDYTASGTQITIAAGATSGSITVTAVDDEENESDETVIVDIVSVAGGNEAGTQQQTTTITDDDAPPTFSVTSLTATESGFIAELSGELDPSALNLYDTQNLALGDADVMLVGASSGPVRGSLVIGDSLSSVTFVKSDGPLEADSYTVTLRSGDDAFKDAGGQLLDGNGDGTTGDDYSGQFEVAEAAAGTVTLSIPDFVRGPGQEVNLPADTTAGIPVTISEGDNVRAVDLRIGYDPAKLSITGATVGEDAPAGATVIVNTTTPGLAILVFFSSTALPAGSSDFVSLQASVPTDNAGDIYGTQQVLDLHGATVSDGNDNESPVKVDDAIQLASYFSDVSGNRRTNAADASQVARFAALIDSGFAGSVLTDPVLAGDVSGNNRINAADASLVAQFAALIDVPVIPPIPGGVVFAGAASDLLPDGRTPSNQPVRVTAPNEASTLDATDDESGESLAYPGVDLFSSIADNQELDASQVDGAMNEEDAFLSSLEDVIDELF